MVQTPIQFIDLKAQQAFIGSRINDAINGVLEHGQYIMGPEVAKFEKMMCEFSNAKHTVSCSNGTDALMMPLYAWNISAGDAVFVPSFTFAATAEAVACMGATPVFVDIDADTYNMDVNGLRRAVEEVVKDGQLRPAAVIGVCLFGQIANYPAMRAIADEFGMKVIADAAQGYGSTWDGDQAHKWAHAVTTSFFPAKPLGCYGDGGAVITESDEDAEILRSVRVHGKGTDKYDNARIGMNARLDTIQAAILLEKLAIFGEEIGKRNAVAKRYNEAFAGKVKTPFVPENIVSTWAQYTLAVENRDEVQKRLKEKNVPTAVYYPKPLHQQTAYKHYPVSGNGLPVSEEMSQKVMSLPMHPYLDEETQNYVIEALVDSL